MNGRFFQFSVPHHARARCQKFCALVNGGNLELYDLLKKVKDEKSFLIFVKALLDERYEDIKLEKENPSSPYSSSHKGWENTTLESFLEASIAWANDSNFGKLQKIKENLWYKFATFLYCGKIYE